MCPFSFCYISLRFVKLRFFKFRYDTFRSVPFNNVLLHFIVFHYITLHYVKLHFVTLHFVTFRHKSLQCAIAAFISCHNSAADLLSVHYMKVYSGFFIFSSINQKKVFLYIYIYRSGPMKRTCCNMPPWRH